MRLEFQSGFAVVLGRTLVLASGLTFFGISLPAQSNRPFFMASTSVQAVPGGSPLYQNTPTATSLQNLSADSDVVAIFPEYLGVPFDDFANSTTLPANHPWAVQMTALAAAAASLGKPVMLETVLTRDVIVGKAVNSNGTLVIQPAGWAPGCVDFTAPQYSGLAAAYVNYVTWLARTFSPRYFVVSVEANLYWVHCGGDSPSWHVLVQAEQNAYSAVKAVNPSIVAFPSFKLEDIYDQQLNGFDQVQYSAMSTMTRDRLGLASYPFGIQFPAGGFANPYQLPSDYFSRIRDKNPTEPKIVLTETGWNSESLSVVSDGSCYANLLYSEPSFESAYMGFVIYFGYLNGFDGVVWWSDRDLVGSGVMPTCYPQATPPAFSECHGNVWCVAISGARSQTPLGWSPAFAELAFKAFGTMGLRSYDSTSKSSLMPLWQLFLSLPRN